jgi:hypothetical protein
MTVYFYVLLIVMDTAHILSPMFLAWTDRELRREAISQRQGFVFTPVIVGCATVLVGVATSLGWTEYTPGLHKMFYIGYQWRLYEPFWPRLLDAAWDCIKIPMPLLMLTYMFWQIWHFGSQNFGVVCLWLRRARRRVPHRQLLRAGCVVGTGLFMVPTIILLFRVPQGFCPGHDFIVTHFGEWSNIPLVLIFIPHWLFALWISAKASSIKYWWLVLIIPIGAVGLLWQHATLQGMMVPNIPWIMSIGVAISMWHYMTDAKLWRRDSTAMRRVLA